jgi:hypothetical protein
VDQARIVAPPKTVVMFVGVAARALRGWSLISPIKTWSDPSPGAAAAALVSVQACP